VAIYEGFIGTKYEIEADNPDEAYEKLLDGEGTEVEVESWVATPNDE